MAATWHPPTAGHITKGCILEKPSSLRLHKDLAETWRAENGVFLDSKRSSSLQARESWRRSEKDSSAARVEPCCSSRRRSERKVRLWLKVLRAGVRLGMLPKSNSPSVVGGGVRRAKTS